ncbi:uncharacterized protein LOC124114796 [Haliotis rufescens]|uniref:uncharacterized protein LOC124114796 n=1 Tax=Haliotis rufescens TaxID=6454 RepID=UPI001EB02A08|nr:uncharacterized protein LOC124114796 [Haliotis rufescens]
MTRPTRRQGILRTAVLVATLNYSIAFLFRGGDNTVRPVNPYGFINETLTLTCTVTTAPGNISGELYFKKTYKNEVKVLPMQYITPTSDRSIRLDYPITSELDQGQYTCIRKTKGFIAEQRVHVEYRPKKVEKIDCRVFDWRNMTCTWDLGVDFIHKDMVKSELYWEIKGGANKCPHPGEKTCTWREIEEGNRLYSNLKPYQTYFMQVNVTVHTKESEESPLATAASDVFSINPLNLVEPAPVHSLTVENMTSTCLYLLWNHGQQSMRRMMYTVLVLRERGSVLKFNTSEREVTVCDLHPARRYELQVSCIPLPHGSNTIRGFYSDWTSIEVETLEDVPSGVPGVRLGSFVSGDCESSPCYATIYWKASVAKITSVT